MALESSFELVMEAAQEFWASKIMLDPAVFKQLEAEIKIRAFTVSGLSKGEELHTVLKAIQRAIDEGTTFKDFQEDCEEIFDRRGFSGKNPYRVANIFQTNIQTAYNVGRYEQLQAETDILQYWLYDAINDGHVRKTHLAMDGRIYPANHPVWNSWYPPNGYGCRCSVSGLTQDQVESQGLAVQKEDPTTSSTEVVDKETGVITTEPPMKPDEGFGTNPAKDYWKSTGEHIRKRLKQYPPELAKMVEKELDGVLKDKGV